MKFEMKSIINVSSPTSFDSFCLYFLKHVSPNIDTVDYTNVEVVCSNKLIVDRVFKSSYNVGQTYNINMWGKSSVSIDRDAHVLKGINSNITMRDIIRLDET